MARLNAERIQSIKIGLFIKEQTYRIKHTTVTRLFVQDIKHYHEDRTHISIKSFDIQLSLVQKTLYLPFCLSLLLVNFFTSQLERLSESRCTIHYHTMLPMHIFSGHEVTRLETIQSQQRPLDCHSEGEEVLVNT